MERPTPILSGIQPLDRAVEEPFMIEGRNLRKSFGDHTVLSDASFSIEASSITAMIGPNGSGKTTTLHVLAGLAAPDAGTALVDGIDVTEDRTAAQERLAFLPQDVRFHSALTPRQVLRFYAGLRPDRKKKGASGPRDASPDRIDALLDEVALLEVDDKPCGTLSGGMRQRLGLAILTLADVPVLLLDEPALSLDPEWRTFLMDRLKTHTNEGGTVLLATHLLDVWTPIVDRVLRCDEGQIQEAPTTNPASPSADVHISSDS